MNPWLRLGPIELPTYYTAITVGFCVATLAIQREIRASGLPGRAVYDIALGILPAAWIGARLFMIFEDPATFLGHPWLLLHPGAGWVFHGGFVCAAVLVLLQARRRGLDPWAVGDTLAPVLPLGIAFGRLGCLGAGCCHGRPADWPLGVEVPWAVRYVLPGQVPESLLAVPLHPAPLYESWLGLALYALLTSLHRRQRFTGQTGAALLAGYGAGRFVVEAFRGDLERQWYGPLSTAQVTGLALVGLGAALAAWRARRSSSAGSAPAARSGAGLGGPEV